jgi:hydrogenase expression/formation protein HypD
MIDVLGAFRDSARALPILDRIRSRETGPVSLMEFCGGHTVAIFRSGIRSVLPPHIRMLSGPGCPVCVTSNQDLDKAVALARVPGVILTSYGDMMRVPGSSASLLDARAEGCAVEVVYSTLDALRIAEQQPERQVVFFAVGFETTAPASAAALILARQRHLKNFSMCSVMKLTTPGARALLDAGEVRIDGVIGPGHVSSIIGADAWRFLPEEHRIPVAIAGFEPLDLLASIDALLRMHERGEASIVNEYTRIVKPGGNEKAWGAVLETFTVNDASWRGFGVLPASGLRVREEYAEFDAERRFDLDVPATVEHHACRCGDVLRGLIEPPACAVFAAGCTPEHPLGPCMVSSEGSCAAYYNYDRHLHT